jgi:hypothetical protein
LTYIHLSTEDVPLVLVYMAATQGLPIRAHFTKLGSISRCWRPVAECGITPRPTCRDEAQHRRSIGPGCGEVEVGAANGTIFLILSPSFPRDARLLLFVFRMHLLFRDAVLTSGSRRPHDNTSGQMFLHAQDPSRRTQIVSSQEGRDDPSAARSLHSRL